MKIKRETGNTKANRKKIKQKKQPSSNTIINNLRICNFSPIKAESNLESFFSLSV